jgi:hypothetical protein
VPPRHAPSAISDPSASGSLRQDRINLQRRAASGGLRLIGTYVRADIQNSRRGTYGREIRAYKRGDPDRQDLSTDHASKLADPVLTTHEDMATSTGHKSSPEGEVAKLDRKGMNS